MRKTPPQHGFLTPSHWLLAMAVLCALGGNAVAATDNAVAATDNAVAATNNAVADTNRAVAVKDTAATNKTAAARKQTTAGNPGRWHSLAAIGAKAERHASSGLAGSGLKLETTVKSLDSRLKLARCDQPLQAFTPRNSEIKQNLVVGVRCRGTRPWQVFVPVQISAKRHVLVVSHPLSRGATLSGADVHLEEREITNIRSAYLTDIGQLQGKVLKRTVPAGRLVTVDLLSEEEIIKRGQRVTLLVEQSGFMVQMAGTALSNGSINERIRVENDSSRRTVEGIVRAPQLVEVITY